MRLSRRVVVVLTAALLAPALPSVAASPLPDVVEPLVRTVGLVTGTTSTSALTPEDRLVGVTWRSGSPDVQVRWRTDGRWSSWEAAEDDSAGADHEPDAVPGTEPLWRPDGADAVQVRVAGPGAGLELVRVGDGERRSGGWSFGTRSADAAVQHPLLGTVQTRADWGADERIRRGSPSYARTVNAVVVHHTAGSNSYAASDVPARIRADYAYHVKNRGWSDLGYNLVVDRFGRIWEGRAGGLGRATIGTHSAGFNTGTLGVSLLGDMTRAQPGAEVVRAMSRVAAYAGRTWGFDPAGSVVLTSGGSPKYRQGTRVTLGRVHGHKDTGSTACPGALYDRLGSIRAGAKALLGPPPQITAVEVTGVPLLSPVPMRVKATVSRSARWSVAVRDSRGRIVASTFGEGAVPELTWHGLVPVTAGGPALLPAPAGTYSWAVAVDDGFHPVVRRTGSLRVGLL